jgi:predicted small lipoprotein YifL
MLRFEQILVSAIVLAGSVASLCACGQQGPLYLPVETTILKPAATPAQKPASTTNPRVPATPSVPQ